MAKQLVFAQTFESLFVRALGGETDPRLKSKLKEIGVDLERPLEPAYPFDVWMKAVDLSAAAVHPALSPAEARFLLGRALIDGYRQTMIGRATLRFLKVMGPHKAVETAANAFKTGNNYTETRLEDVGPRQVELWLNEVGPFPEFTAGIVAAGVEASGASEVKVDCIAHDGHAATYAISWVS